MIGNVTTQGLNRVQKRFSKMQTRMINPKHAMDLIGAKAFKDVINSFDIEQNEDGSKWPRWKGKDGRRVSERPTKRGGNKMLQDTARLKVANRWASTKTQAKVYNKVKYAKFHNFGTKFMPVRQFMWVSSKVREKFLRQLLSYING